MRRQADAKVPLGGLVRAVSVIGFMVVAALLSPAEARAGVRQTSYEKCGPADCYELAVSCEGLADRHVRVRQFTTRRSRGSILLTVGGFGRGRYNGMPIRQKTQEALVEAGFEVFQVEWLGDDGWGTDAWGAGLKKVLCAYAEVARWIVAERANNPDVTCAQGNSGGSLQNGYGLALYGLEDVLDMVIMTGGPPLSRMDQYCFRGPGSAVEQNPNRPEMVASTGRTLIDKVMGWEGTSDLCKRLVTPDAEYIEALQRESLVPPGDRSEFDYDYPRTHIHFVEAQGDDAAEQGRMFYDVVTSHKVWHDIPSEIHRIDNTKEGAKKILELFETECREHGP